jgi:2-dehydro-3-deoxyphosphooctonate aldolase (KDO 8-P synthase)
MPVMNATGKSKMSQKMKPDEVVKVGDVEISNTAPFALFAGPCQLESRAHGLEMAHGLKEICQRLGIGLIFKASFDKANRTSISSERGLGFADSLPIFAEIRETYGLPVVTDVHEAAHCVPAAKAVDVLQIPAFLCRQTDLLVAAAQTGAVIKVKKGQFLAPWDMKNVVGKVLAAGNRRILVTERGASFGYNTLVSDMRSLPILAGTGCPVVFDATHSVQQPGGQGETSGGQREFVPVLARAALAVGVAALFVETHEDPDNAPSDGPNMVHLSKLEDFLRQWQQIDKVIKS